MKKKVFVSFDYRQDNDKKGSLIAQAEDPDAPFTIVDFLSRRPHQSSFG